VLPEERIVLGTLSIPQLDTVVPDDDLSTEIRFRGVFSEIAEGISGPHPAVAGQR
jgi:hypothetical protein